MGAHHFETKPDGEFLTAHITAADLGFPPSGLWNPSPSVHHRTEPYEVPEEVEIGLKITEKTGAKLSPPPYAVEVETEGERALVALVAEPGYHLWNQAEFAADAEGVTVKVDTEGHANPAALAPRVSVGVLRGNPAEGPMDLLARGMRELYPEGTAEPEEPKPEWWHRPIYCGWGDQVSISMWLEGVGNEWRAGNYCIQGLYDRWISRLEEADVPLGSVTIDAGWSTGRLEPNSKWPDMGGFIASQHEAGRRVLLWIGTFPGAADLPEDWCYEGPDGKRRADPTHPEYRAFLRRRVEELISPEGYDADGFKIDQLSRGPTERRPWRGTGRGGTKTRDPEHSLIDLAGEGWGCELLREHQMDIYGPAKKAKSDSLITSSTVHPYFHDTLDMVRLHDTGQVEDVMAAMGARARLARAALPGKLVDTDDWTSRDYDLWMEYTTSSHRIGTPCLFYAERFMENWEEEPATRLIPLEDLRKIGETWREVGLAQIQD
jgi:hypothetical protein